MRPENLCAKPTLGMAGDAVGGGEDVSKVNGIYNQTFLILDKPTLRER